MPTINYSAALPPDIYTQNSAGAVNLGNYINTLRSDISFLIKQLFANSEQGFTQTLDDYSILFQDAAGTTALTGAGQTLGLVLDKSKGLVLGGELSVNGDFSTNDFTGWTHPDTAPAVTSVANQQVTMTVTSTALARLRQAVTVPAGYYKISLDVKSITGTPQAALAIGNTTSGDATYYNQTLTSAKTYSFILYIQSGTLGLAFTAGSSVGGSITMDNISIKSLSGNHSYQTASSMRPLLQNAPRRIQYDGIDDKLTTTLPAQLTGCTVIRAIPNVGCQILTNQTIATPYNDSTNHCGLIVINRALTAYETSLVTQLFNKLAGV
ncbi:hypothetical protein E0H86_07150 [Acinetobacter sp. ANC 4635]|uniref:hypothetical protein n=1 Tax=Acinetobacter sp. ANC 4635 TaxID=2529846 RepID=UPI00103AD4AA|nr:hypothetical protein [Acinetobacter sp. ANC 4635]TCB32185.1 hypothetical protein E0H86_07150 [Acinetobacter sp. ANC 4635]